MSLRQFLWNVKWLWIEMRVVMSGHVCDGPMSLRQYLGNVGVSFRLYMWQLWVGVSTWRLWVWLWLHIRKWEQFWAPGCLKRAQNTLIYLLHVLYIHPPPPHPPNFQFSGSGIQSAGWCFNPMIPRLWLGSKPRAFISCQTLLLYCVEMLLEKVFPPDYWEREDWCNTSISKASLSPSSNTRSAFFIFI